jgi:competence protein ComFC
MKLLDLIFPKRCVNCRKSGEYICDNCFSYLSFDVKNLCLVCIQPSYNGITHQKCKNKYSIDGIISAISYNKIAKKLIYSFKHKPYISDLGGFLSELFTESIIQNEEFNKSIASDKWLLVPIPLSSSELRKRGYNQSQILAKALSEKLNIKVLDVLKKKDSTGQFVFELRNQEKILNENIFLVDDIVTTGKTLKDAARLLKMSGVKQVFGLTLARG